MRERLYTKPVFESAHDEVSPKSERLSEILAGGRRGRKANSGTENGSDKTNVSENGKNNVSRQSLFQSLDSFPSTENGEDEIPGEGSAEPEGRSINFDKLFGSFSTMLPGIVWALIASLLGREGEQASPAAMKTMTEGWKSFFDGCGVEYVGEGLSMKLRSPFWLLLIPVVATLAAVASEFGLSSLMEAKRQEQRAAETVPEPVSQ